MPAAAPILDAILASPSLPDYAEVINTRLREERQRRQRFYAEMSDEHKMEFIEGEIIMHSPARNWHLVTKLNLASLLNLFVRIHKLGAVRDEKCLCVFPRNDYEPDIVFFGPEKAAALQPDQLKFPVPDLAVEVLSESTERRDRGVKFADFEAHGVSEYWIIDPETRTLEQYVNDAGTFRLQTKSGTGELLSTIVPGFCIPIPAIFNDDAHLAAMRAML